MLTSIERLLFIRGVPIFKELRDDFLVRLASVMDEVLFETNYTIITEGHEGRAMYIVVSGKVSVHLKGQELARLDEGTCFGEMSVFDAEPRSASVTTIEPCNCLVLTQQQLYDAIDDTPGIAVNVIRLLSRRIRELNREFNLKQQKMNRQASWGVSQSLPSEQIPGTQQHHRTHPDSSDIPAPQTGMSGTAVPGWNSAFPLGNVL
jgi:CRP-like cAMP-binding protein